MYYGLFWPANMHLLYWRLPSLNIKTELAGAMSQGIEGYFQSLQSHNHCQMGILSTLQEYEN